MEVQYRYSSSEIPDLETRDVHLLLCLNCTNQIVTFGRSQIRLPGIPILLATAVPRLNFHKRLLSAVKPLKLVCFS